MFLSSKLECINENMQENEMQGWAWNFNGWDTIHSLSYLKYLAYCVQFGFNRPQIIKSINQDWPMWPNVTTRTQATSESCIGVPVSQDLRFLLLLYGEDISTNLNIPSNIFFLIIPFNLKPSLYNKEGKKMLKLLTGFPIWPNGIFFIPRRND